MLSLHQLYTKMINEVGEPGSAPPMPPGGATAPPPGADPMAGSLPPGAPPNSPPGGDQKPIEIKAGNWLDFMEKALDKLEEKPTADDNNNQDEDQDQQNQSPPNQPADPNAGNLPQPGMNEPALGGAAQSADMPPDQSGTQGM